MNDLFTTSADNQSSATKRFYLQILCGVALGAAIWGLSPWVTGEDEPWDARGQYYIFSLCICGFVAAAIYPQYFWLSPVSIFVGQSAYIFTFLPWGPLWPIGLIVMSFYSVFTFGGAVVASGVFLFVRRIHKSTPNIKT